ncbi:MAG: hypothetical protein WD294_00005 [Phycisphaeraceae bacterium]
MVDVFTAGYRNSPYQQSRFVELRTANGQRVLAEVDPRNFDPPIVIDRGDYLHIIGQPTRINDQPVLDTYHVMDIGTLERQRMHRIRSEAPTGLETPLQRDLRIDQRLQPSPYGR